MNRKAELEKAKEAGNEIVKNSTADKSTDKSGKGVLDKVQDWFSPLKSSSKNPANKKLDYDQAVEDVIAGKYGNGAERIDNLTNAGYDPLKVQNMVNKKAYGADADADIDEVEDEVDAADDEVEETDTDADETDTATDETEDIEYAENGQPIVKEDWDPEQKKANEIGDYIKGLKKEAIDAINNSDEGKKANNALQNKDPKKAYDPEYGTVDESGVLIPKVWTADDFRSKNYKTDLLLTILSGVVTGLSAVVGVPIPFVNFIALNRDPRNAQIAAQQANSIGKEYGEMYNSGMADYNANKNANKSVKENADLANELGEENLAKATKVKQSQTGTETTREATDAKADAEIKLADKVADNDIKVMREKYKNDEKLYNAMANTDVKRVVMAIEALREKGYTYDDIAKYESSMQGNTRLARGLNYINTALGGFSNLLSSMKKAESTDNSDKNVKKYSYDAKSANSKMLDNARRKSYGF